jgi:hypothetical protein
MICLKGQFTRLSRPDANFKYKFWPEMTERFTTMPEVASRQNSKLKSHRTATLERLHRTRKQTFNCLKKINSSSASRRATTSNRHFTKTTAV